MAPNLIYRSIGVDAFKKGGLLAPIGFAKGSVYSLLAVLNMRLIALMTNWWSNPRLWSIHISGVSAPVVQKRRWRWMGEAQWQLRNYS